MDSLDRLFDRVFVVNLAHRRDRYEEMGAQLRRIGMHWGHPKVERFEAVRPADAGGFPTLGARGCFFSHLGVQRTAVQQGLSSILILEDDCDLVDDFEPRLQAVQQALAGIDWALLHGGLAPPRAGAQTLRRLAGDEALQQTHFIALRGAALRLLPEFLQRMADRAPGHPEGGPMHVDGAYHWFRRAHPELACFVAEPPLAYQRASRTDIHALSWRDRVPLVRELVAFGRKINNRRPRA